MPFIPNGFGQATLAFSIPGSSGPAMMTFGYTKAAALNSDQAAEAIHDAYTAPGSLIGRHDSNTGLGFVSTLERFTGELFSGIFIEQVQGGIAATGAPPQCAMLIQKLTGFAGRNRRGRMYMPGTTALPEDGVYGSGEVTATQASADQFLAALVTADLDMVLLHVNETDTPTPITSLVVQGLAATQRRRLR